MKQITIIEQSDNNQYTLQDSGSKSLLREFEGFEFADIRNSIDNVAGDYGAVYVNSKYGRRRMAIRGDFLSSDVYTQRRLFNRALRQTGVMKLIKFTTYDDLLLQCEAEVSKLVNPYTHKVHTFLLELIAPDWRFYSQTLQSINIGQTLIKGGASIPATIPMSIASPTSSETEFLNIITNNGNEKTDPIIIISGPGTGFLIGNESTGEEFELSSALVEGDSVVIDVKRRTVVKNGTTNLYGDFTGDFWSIIPGDNELRFLVDNGHELGITNLNIAFRDAYNGI